MQELVIKQDLWMDSREIAELTGKRHDHVLRDIETQLSEVDGGLPRFGASYLNSQNKQQPCYRLPFRETMIVISGYSVELRTKIIDRWMELETKNKTPQTFAQALRLAADQAEQIELMKPKVESFEALQRSNGNMSITDASKHFGLHVKMEVYPFLRSHGYLTGKNQASQKAIDEKILSTKESKGNDGKFRPQPVVDNSSLEIWRTKIVEKIKDINKVRKAYNKINESTENIDY